jgi:alpha/beta hydrolase fold
MYTSPMRAIGLLVLMLSIGPPPAPVSAAPLENLRASGKADVNGGHLYYEVYGHGAPLVFLHAGIADSRMWDRQVNYFSRKFTVVRFDTRGYGKSDPPTHLMLQPRMCTLFSSS